VQQIILDDGRVYTLDRDGSVPELNLKFTGAVTVKGRKTLRPYFWVEVLRDGDSIHWKRQDGSQWTFLHTPEGVWKGGKGVGRGHKACGYIVRSVAPGELRSIDA
jgi:hypothetical protein